MKNFWRTLAINAIIRALSGVALVLVNKGYVTDSQKAILVETVAIIAFNVGQTVVNRLLARWHLNFAKLADPNASTRELVEIASETPVLTKLAQSIGPKPTAEDVGLPPAEESQVIVEDERVTKGPQ